MKNSLKHFFFISFLVVLVNNSCKKEKSCEGCIGNNKPPIAIAGPDQLIALPTDSALLDGRSSSDPDGTISNWLWTKISGPALINFSNSPSSLVVVKNLIAGTYLFELKVTDNGGLSAKDTMQVIVNSSTQTNRPPVARAGADQTITLPTNSVTIDGNASTDPDNNISSYLWTKISGPSTFILTSANAVQTQVTNLTEGTYQFELKVTDAGGLFSLDTMQVAVSTQPPPPNNCDNNRPLINATMVPVGNLSVARSYVSISASGNKIVFAGGQEAINYSSRVDIYDISTQTWTTAELCKERILIAAVSSGNKIFFAGGEIGDGTWPVDSVDIYDVGTNTWAVSHLSTAGNSIAAAAVGDKVLFAGGDGGFTGPGRESRVDIYNLTTNNWSTATLSEVKRGWHAAVSLNDKVYFAGGETWPNWTIGNYGASSKIDIYDNTSNSWSTGNLLTARMGLTGITANDKIYWAGGQTGWYPSFSLTCSVEITDQSNNLNLINYLSEPAWWGTASGEKAVLKNNRIVYYRPGNNKFDIYDINSNTWSIGILAQPIPVGASIISVNNTIYIAGGYANGVYLNQVWKLEF
jgi:PKD domain/Kelch motif/Galactose oxidase, central domain